MELQGYRIVRPFGREVILICSRLSFLLFVNATSIDLLSDCDASTPAISIHTTALMVTFTLTTKAH